MASSRVRSLVRPVAHLAEHFISGAPAGGSSVWAQARCLSSAATLVYALQGAAKAWEAEDAVSAKTARRKQFAVGMADMYGAEVPLYDDVVALVEKNNRVCMEGGYKTGGDSLERVTRERHGAIRLGTPEELAMMKRIFEIMGMRPVDYYDLTASGLPVHSTAFRPTTKEELADDPFRMFCSVLRTDLLPEDIRVTVDPILKGRKIFSDELVHLVEVFEHEGRFTKEQEETFQREVANVFRWQPEAVVTKATYEGLLERGGGLAADVVSFPGPHINHLTPRALAITMVHRILQAEGMATIPAIQGPPHREVPILLRQTSIRALPVPVTFLGGLEGMHTARFAEIEQRGMALTPKGRELYDRLLASVTEQAKVLSAEEYPVEYPKILGRVFAEFPDDWETVRTSGLGYFTYTATSKGIEAAAEGDLPKDLSKLVELGYVKAEGITYEDFLPISATGIFQSNLGTQSGGVVVAASNQEMFEAGLGCPVHSSFELYNAEQELSIMQTCELLGIDRVELRTPNDPRKVAWAEKAFGGAEGHAR